MNSVAGKKFLLSGYTFLSGVGDLGEEVTM